MIFPLKVKPQNDYTNGGDSFGADRWTDKNKDGSVQRQEIRKHAGIDLYTEEGTAVYAIESGKVFQSYENFYLGAGAIEIIGAKYTIRYAEISPAVKSGMTIKEGQLIGYVKRCLGIKQAMLHLEFYSMTLSKFPLTNRQNPPFFRRSDLIDPTKIILDLQESFFNTF